MDGRAAKPGQLVDLVLENHVLGPARPVDEGEVAARCRQLFQKGSQWSDTDAARDQEDPRLGPSRAGQGAVRALDEDRGSDGHPLQLARVVAEFLDREPQELAVRGG